VKPFEIPASKPAIPKQDLGQVSQDAGSELAQRLWQLLLALPEAGEIDTVSAAAMGSTGSAQGHRRSQDERDRDATSELTATAHMLAAAVHQLGLTGYTQHAEASGHRAPPSAAEGFHVQLGHVDAQGGSATLQVAHPQLGDIALEVELSNGVLRVIASAPNEYAAQVLLEGQAQLAERLLRQGVALEVLDVVVTNKRKESQRARARARKQER
jgi:hypothetical protein